METPEIKKILVNSFFENFPAEAADILNHASAEEILQHLRDQPPNLAREILLRIRTDTAAAVVEIMDDDLFLILFPTFDPYMGALLISRLKETTINQKLALLTKKKQTEIRELMTYPASSAGFIMDTRIITFHPSNTVEEVIEKLRKLTDQRLVNIYIVDDLGKLLGRAPLEVIAISSPQELLGNLLESSLSVHVMAPMDEVVEIQKRNNVLNLPVVDLDHRLLGLIRNDALVKAARQDATGDLQTIFGAGREERALSKVTFAIRKRLPWLEINLATAFLAAAVVGIFEDTIAKITVLAVFLPVVAGQSGNTGSQALAVTMRGLALREIHVGQWWKVARKEVMVGFFNGVAVSLTTAIIVYFWASSTGLAMVIGVSMVFSMVIAGFAGAVIPIVLKSMGQDPAQSSSIILTTVTDVVGFISFLGLATVMSNMIGVG